MGNGFSKDPCMKPLLLALLLLPTIAHAEEERTWHLLQRQANGGIAGIVHGLTHAECEFGRKRIEGLPATPEEEAAEKAKTDALFQIVADARKAHPKCDSFNIIPMMSADPYVQDPGNGFCRVGAPTQLFRESRTLSPTDIEHAECFK